MPDGTKNSILHEGDYDLELLGFDDVELARLLAAQDAYPGLTDEDAVLEPPANPVSKSGDLFLLGDHRLVCGDCTDPNVVARLLAGALREARPASPRRPEDTYRYLRITRRHGAAEQPAKKPCANNDADQRADDRQQKL